MTAKAKQILITTESHEVFIIRQSGKHTVPGFCPECNRQVEMMDFDTASHLGIGGRELMQRSEFGDIHSIESTTGHLLICKRSLEIRQT
jgi:hypothetical protein